MRAITVRDREAGVSGLTLTDLAQHLRAGWLSPIVSAVRPLSETASAFARHRLTPGKTIIQVADEQGTQRS